MDKLNALEMLTTQRLSIAEVARKLGVSEDESDYDSSVGGVCSGRGDPVLLGKVKPAQVVSH